MLVWLKALFSSQSETTVADRSETDDLWDAMSRMDPWLTRERFISLNLPKEQQAEIEGIVTGTRRPSEYTGVTDWAAENCVDPDGIDATVYAVQREMKGRKTFYLFEHGSDFPRARFPKFVDKDSATIFFDDHEGHLRIGSLAELVSENSIGRYAIEPHDLGSLQHRMTGRGRQRPASSIASITLERKVGENDLVLDPVDAEAIVAALDQEGLEVASSQVTLESPLVKLGLYTIVIHNDSDEDTKIKVWVVPSAA